MNEENKDAIPASEKIDNLALWNSVEKTNPKYTKKVNSRGGFTAINAEYQIQMATKQWGPYGSSWGIRKQVWTYLQLESNKAPYEVILEAYFYYPGGEFEISSDMIYKAGNDTRKKLLTDLTTKALSKLGFNADVFLGRYDDNKYMQEITAEFKEPVKSIPKQELTDISDYIIQFGKYKDQKINEVNFDDLVGYYNYVKEKAGPQATIKSPWVIDFLKYTSEFIDSKMTS